ncbi:MAG: hypothetical protein KC503_28950 [Myxococcales bacterium]|nr:hypothetical protein [Myxococcales bacterium]
MVYDVTCTRHNQRHVAVDLADKTESSLPTQPAHEDEHVLVSADHQLSRRIVGSGQHCKRVVVSFEQIGCGRRHGAKLSVL